MVEGEKQLDQVQCRALKYTYKRAFDKVRKFFRFRTAMKQHDSMAQQHKVSGQRLETLNAMVLVA